MTPRERILTALRHERPDRTPTKLGARPEVNRALIEYYGVETIGEVQDIIGADGWASVGYGIAFPGYEERTTDRLVGDCPYAGARYVFHDENTFEDEWGVVRKVGSDRKYVEWITGPLAGVEDPDEYDFPGLDRLIDDGTVPERVAKLKAEGKFVMCGVANPFKTAWELRGLQNILADYITAPEFIEKLYDKMVILYGEMWARAAEAGVDMVTMTGDVAMQDRIIMGPERWRQVDKPKLAEMVRRATEKNPDVHVLIHSDGALWDIMDDLIEIGFDVVDPIQPECMDPIEVKKRYGDRITLHGGGSIQHTLPFGTVEDVRRHVIELIEGCGYDGGFVLRASNVIGFDTPIENVVAFFETARDYRWE